jgi:hypothetical protein
MGFYLSTILIASFVYVAAPAYARVRVITGDIEHFYGPGGELLDDAELRARNERVERSRRAKEARPQSPPPRPARRNEPGRSNFNPAPISGRNSI